MSLIEKKIDAIYDATQALFKSTKWVRLHLYWVALLALATAFVLFTEVHRVTILRDRIIRLEGQVDGITKVRRLSSGTDAAQD